MLGVPAVAPLHVQKTTPWAREAFNQQEDPYHPTNTGCTGECLRVRSFHDRTVIGHIVWVYHIP